MCEQASACGSRAKIEAKKKNEATLIKIINSVSRIMTRITINFVKEDGFQSNLKSRVSLLYLDRELQRGLINKCSGTPSLLLEIPETTSKPAF